MEVWDANLLYSAYLKAIKSSKWKSSTQKYRMHWMMAFHKYMPKRQINNMVLLICKLFHSQIPTWKESNNLIQLATPSKRKLIKSQYLVAS